MPMKFYASRSRVETLNVLEIDTVDSTKLLDTLGQHAANQLSDVIERTLRKAVSRAGGLTVKGMGDGILAVFPSASAAIQGACAAFQTVSAFEAYGGKRVQLRGGIAAGDVAIIDDDIRGQAAVVASRLQSAAKPNTILCTETVYALSAGETKCKITKEDKHLTLKNIPQPVQAYDIDWAGAPSALGSDLDVPSRLTAELESRFPFANRVGELAVLGTLADQARPKLTLVRGPEGIGKTRLIAQWAKGIQQDGGFVFYCRGGTSTSDNLRELTGALRELTSSPAHERLDTTSSDYERTCSKILDILESSTDVDHGHVVGVVVDLLTELGRDSPTILIVDDLQSASSTVFDIFHRVVDEPIANVFLVGVFTTGLDSEETGTSDIELANQFPLSERVSSLELGPLDYAGVVEWMEHQPMLTLKKDAPVPLDDIGRGIAEAFFEASGGVPNLLGLVIRDLYESPEGVAMDQEGRWRALCDLESLRRSHSADQVVRGRLDRLPPEVRETLEIGSVIGLDIDADVLRRVSNYPPETLTQHIKLAGRRNFVRTDDGVTRFETDATRRAIYRLVSPGQRADIHEAVAGALKNRASDGNTLVPDVQIARHLSEVARTRGGQSADTAASHYIHGARRAIATEPLDAVNLAHEALALLDKFELVDDQQLRQAAHQVVKDAQDELGRSTSDDSRELAASLRARPGSD